MSDERFSRVQTAFNVAFGADRDSIRLESGPAEVPGWDSLGHVTLVSALEKVFGTTFEVDEVMEMEDVAAILRILAARGL